MQRVWYSPKVLTLQSQGTRRRRKVRKRGRREKVFPEEEPTN